MPRTHMIPSDPFVANRIHDALTGAPEVRPKLDLPKPTPAQLLQTWKIKAAARESPGYRKTVIEARWHPVSRPRLPYSPQSYDAAFTEPESTED